MFARNFSFEFDAYCITDKKFGLDQQYNAISSNPKLAGWWNKISIFNQKLRHKHTVYVDLDLLILGNLDEIVLHALQQDRQMACFADHIGWHDIKFGSALMIFEQDRLRWLYNEFEKSLESNQREVGGDQIWLGKRLDDVLYLDEVFPNLVKSLKVDLAHSVKTSSNRISSIELPKNIEKDFLLLNCHGQPKPHQLNDIGWEPINEIWV
jgi:hypothetical protein